MSEYNPGRDDWESRQRDIIHGFDPDDFTTVEGRLLWEIREILIEIHGLLEQRLRRTV